MHTITIRQLQREFYAHINNLPLVVTKNGKPIFKIEAITDVVTNPVDVVTNVVTNPVDVVTNTEELDEDVNRCVAIKENRLRCINAVVPGKNKCNWHLKNA